MDCGSCNPMYNQCGSCGPGTKEKVSDKVAEQTAKHPCYSAEAHHKYARMHLPVAPKCNIGCNYCNRKYDCVNESRPGVTSEVLSPEAAAQKYLAVKERIPNLSVVGIAGPGDALANWPETKKTLKAIREIDPEVVFCLSTNGLMLPNYARELVALGVNHITVTMNCLDPKIGAKIYRFVNYAGEVFEGEAGAALLLSNQLQGIKYLTSHGVLVKINIVMVKGVNDYHIPEVVRKAKELGAFVTNIMPLIPAPGSAFELFPQTSTKDLNRMRDLCQIDMPQMRHCRQCRADAIGMLGDDRSKEFTNFNPQETSPREISQSHDTQPKSSLPSEVAPKFKIAVASNHGMLVDQHFGHAERFAIYLSDGTNYELVEYRQVQKYCMGVEECDSEEQRRDGILQTIMDCDAVLSMRIGYSAKQNLLGKGIVSVESCDTVENGLKATVQFLRERNIA